MRLEIPNKRHKHFELTPLIDIVFNMLLFFILSYQVSRYSDIKVDIPNSKIRNQVSKGIEIVITSTHEIYLNGLKTDVNSIEKILGGFDRKNNIILRADRKLELDFLVKIIDSISSLGFENFSILTYYEK